MERKLEKIAIMERKLEKIIAIIKYTVWILFVRSGF